MIGFRRPSAGWVRAIPLLLLLLGAPIPTLAGICCQCIPSGDTGAVCVQGVATDCQALANNSTNEVLKHAKCYPTSLDETKCREQSKQGQCEVGPVSEDLFGKPLPSPELNVPALIPSLNVDIPGLIFTNTLTSEGGKLSIPFFAQYIAAIYKYLTVISGIAAAIMIVYGGFLYIVGSAAPSIKRGKEIITNAVIGLILILGSYVILYTINPNTLNLQSIRAQHITTIDYILLSRQYGFKETDGAANREKDAYDATDPGTAPSIADQTGGNISIDDIDAKGTAPERLNSYCSTAGDRQKMKTYEEKIQALVRVVLGWKKTCVDESGCAYLRSGYTAIPSGKIVITKVDAGYVKGALAAYDGGLQWSSSCAEQWDALGQKFYEPIQPKSGSKEDIAAAIAERDERNAPFNPGGECYDQMHDQYQKEFGDRMEAQGIFGGDCGTTLVQMYACAGGQTARGDASKYTSGAVFGGAVERPAGRDIVVFRAMSWMDYVAQVNAAGGLRFGDLFIVGQQNWQHNFMYTGGRADVPFDWFEMGSSGRDGLSGQPVTINGLNAPLGGMWAWPRGTPPDYFMELAKKRGRSIFPVYVVRPFDYDPCTTREECNVGQTCHCNTVDIPNYLPPGVDVWGFVNQNMCSLDAICHRAYPGIACQTDEQCGKGFTCKKGVNKTQGTCNSTPVIP